MSATETAGRRRQPSYLSASHTVSSWLLTRDHKRIGVLFLVATGVFLFAGGLFALLLRLEHLTPDRTVMDTMTYNRMFSLHGVVMVWLFMIPAIPSGFGNFLLPIMIGAPDVAFPRLNLLSFWLFAAGAAVVVGSMIAGALDTGWTFYTPYSAQSPTAVVPAVVGVFIAGLSTIVSGLNFIVTVHTMRAEGLGWMRMPLFAWAVYATSIIQVLATPVLGMALLLVAAEHALDMGIFDAARGGDPVLFQHLFWFYSHPAVYIMILPAMGVISEVASTFARKNPLSYRALVFSSLGIAFVGFLTWGHHMFTAGISTFSAGAFGVLSMLVAIFSAIKVYTWVGTLYRGSVSPKTPFLYLMIFLFLFVFGGMTGVAVATTSLDTHWHDSYFIVAHFHFIMVGGVMASYLAALHYWFPKITGRMYPERMGLVAAALVFVGFAVTFTPQFLLGNAGLPRRSFAYPDEHQALHVISTVGSWILGAGLVVTLAYLGHALLFGRRAGDNPWGSSSFEWRTSSPPPLHNFEGAPRLSRDAYDYSVADREAHG